MSSAKAHDPSQPTPDPVKKRSWLRRIWRWFWRCMMVLMVIFVLINLAFLIPAVQRVLVRSLTHSIGNNLGTEISIDQFQLAWYDQLLLEKFYVEDLRGDTLLYAHRLYADLDLRPWVVLTEGLVIEGVSLEKTQLNIHRGVFDSRDNLQQILDKTKKNKDPNAPPGNFKMRVDELEMDDFCLRIVNDKTANHLEVCVDEGKLLGEIVDVNQEYFELPFVEANGVNVLSQKFTPPDSVALDDPGSSLLWVTVCDFNINDGRFQLDNFDKAPEKTTPDDILDWNHLLVENIQFEMQNFEYRDGYWWGVQGNLSLVESSGFMLEKLAVEQGTVQPRFMELNGVEVVTPESRMGDTLVFRYKGYSDFSNFTTDVRLSANFNESHLAIDDIITFAPKLAENPFFAQNHSLPIQLDGDFRGSVNQLRGRDLNLALPDGSFLKGQFTLRDLTASDNPFVDARLDVMRTNIHTIRKILPNFNPPENFDRLGNLRFDGTFFGFVKDFNAYGRLDTDLGEAETDISMVVADSRANTTYRGNIKLVDFDLGAWSANPDFGIVNFSARVEEGRGLTAETAKAKLEAVVESFSFKEYNYENARVNGTLNDNFFDGTFSITDENIAVNFDGALDFRDSFPVLNFAADIDQLHLKHLNLIERDIALSAQSLNLNLSNGRIEDLLGMAYVEQLRIREGKEEEYLIDSIALRSYFDRYGQRHFTLESDLVQADIIGNYKIEDVPSALTSYFTERYPKLTQRIGIKPPQKSANESSFTFDVDIVDTKGVNALLDPKLGTIKEAKVKGFYFGPLDSLRLEVNTPRFQFDNIEWFDLAVNLNGFEEEAEFHIRVDETRINDKNSFPAVDLGGYLYQDTLFYDFNYASNKGLALSNLALKGQLYTIDSLDWEARLESFNLIINKMPWIIRPNNFLRFGQGRVLARDIVLENGDRRITLNSYDKSGLNLLITGFHFDFIDDLWDYEQLDFDGDFVGEVFVDDIFKLEGIKATVTGDTMYINNDDWGRFQLKGRAASLKSPFQAYLELARDEQQLIVEGYYNPKNMQVIPAVQSGWKNTPNFLNMNIFGQGLPVALAQYWIGSAITDVTGTFGADLRIFGELPDLQTSGDILAENGGFTIDFLKTRYTFEESLITASSNFFDASGTILYDKLGHKAVLQGGMTHEQLKNLGFRAQLNTERFLALDTKKGDNELFYGQALGSGNVIFSGTTQKPDIYVNASVNDSSFLVIPVQEAGTSSKLNFVDFVNKNAIDKDSTKNDDNALQGVALEMDITIGPQASAEIVFDEKAGDIVRGSGRGNLQINVDRSGEFRMYGDYFINKGKYLFTLYNVIAKEFVVKPGGHVKWTGDPFGARLNLEAGYSNARAAPAGLIQEFMRFAPDDVQTEANRPTAIDLTLKLEGPLLQPRISFDMDFPELRGPLQSYVNNKMGYLKQNPNELNRQVFGVILVGEFLPTDFSIATSDIILNTMSEFLSNQLSQLVTNLFSSGVDEDSFMKGLDFKIGYNQSKSEDIAGTSVITGDEFEVRLAQKFLDDRLTIEIGGNVLSGSSFENTSASSGAFVGNDLVIEYAITEDRDWTFRIYQSYQPDFAAGHRFEVGGGLSFRKEYGSFNEFWRSLSGKKKSEEN